MPKPQGVMTFLTMACLLSCGGPEQSAVDTFFTAVKNGDAAARAAVSVVGFPTGVESWEIVETGPETIVAFPLTELNRKVRDAKRELDYHLEKKGYFLKDNARLYAQYQARLEKEPDFTPKGELAEFATQLQGLDEQEKEREQAMEEASQAVSKEKGVAGISLMGSTVTENLEGDVAVREVRVRVKGDGGDKPYRLTLRKYDLVDKQTGARQRSRWVISQIEEQG